MKKVNLKIEYSVDGNCIVADEIADFLAAARRADAAFQRRQRYHHATYSLDVGDGIETASLYTVPTPSKLVEQKEQQIQLYAAMAQLPPKQYRRIYGHLF